MTEKVFRNSVKSSNIAAIGWHGDIQDSDVAEDKATGSTYVEFTSGKIYIYHKVPMTVYQEFKTAHSVGSYFAKHIKNSFECIAFAGKADELFLPTDYVENKEQAV